MLTADIYTTIVLVVSTLTAVLALVLSIKSIREEFSRSKLKLDISIEEMRELESNVSAFLADNGIAPGSSIWSIAERLNIQEGGDVKGQKTQALLSKPNANGKMIVTFSRGLTQEEKIFAFAHECAHLVNKDDVPVARPQGRNKPLPEQLADYTAAALLMPLDSVYNLLVENNYLKATTRARMKIVRHLCAKYQVSDVIAIRRIQEVYVLKKNKA